MAGYLAMFFFFHGFMERDGAEGHKLQKKNKPSWPNKLGP